MSVLTVFSVSHSFSTLTPPTGAWQRKEDQENKALNKKKNPKATQRTCFGSCSWLQNIIHTKDRQARQCRQFSNIWTAQQFTWAMRWSSPVRGTCERRHLSVWQLFCRLFMCPWDFVLQLWMCLFILSLILPDGDLCYTKWWSTINSVCQTDCYGYHIKSSRNFSIIFFFLPIRTVWLN